MFIHAVTGCDMTSRIFGVGKKTAFQKLIKGDPVLQSCANAFTVPNQTTEKVVSAASTITPEHLPPTESATKFHCRRAY